MPKKRHKAEEIVAKLRQVEVLAAQRKPVAEAIRLGLAIDGAAPTSAFAALR